MAERESLTSAPALAADAEFAIGALRSNQDVLLHKVERNEAVRQQLEVNLAAIVALREALARRGVIVT